MKKILFLGVAAATLALVACNKTETDVPAGERYTITGVIDASATKTAYEESAGKAVFTWKAADRIHVVVYNASSPFTADKYAFTADTDGTSVNFTSTGTPDFTAYPKSGFAVYPSNVVSTGGVKDNYTITLPAEYTVSGSDFSRVGIPLIGTETTEDKYSFKTAVGVVKLTLTNVPVTARKLVLTSASDNLSGTFPLNATTAAEGLSMADAASAGHSLTINFSQQAAGASVDLYIPLPAGSISAGATFDVQDGSGNSIKSVTTQSAIPVTRNKVQPIGSVAVEEWVSLGTGKFMDDDAFYASGHGGRTVADYVDVEIQQHATETKRYRVVNPYQAYMTQKGKSAMSGAVGPGEYLTFTIEDGYVANDSYRTGLQYYSYGYELAYDNPVWYGSAYNKWNNCVIKEDGDKWTNIQLAPLYFNNSSWSLVNNASENPKIEIVRPGYDPIRLHYNNYPGTVSASVSGNQVTVSWTSEYISSVKTVLGASLDECVAALKAGGSNVLTFTGSGTSQAANVTSGAYVLVSQIMTDGHGWTFRNHGNVYVSSYPQITLTADMVSPIATETGEGSVAALVDGSTSNTSYWHSPWSVTGTYDATYGVYIDIDLGEGNGVKNFELRLCPRAGASNDYPDHIKIYASNDKTAWGDALAEQSNLYGNGYSNGLWYPAFACSASDAKRYIRISILSTNGSNANVSDLRSSGCTHLGEIALNGEQ